MSKLSLFGGTGFVLGNYARMYPDEVVIEPRAALVPSCENVLFGVSTTDNYHPLRGDLEIDIDTNLGHLVRVLRNVRGQFTFLSSWFVYSGGRDYTAAAPARETDNGRPIGFYSGTKLCAELLVESWCRTNNIPFRILRLCNVIGNDPRASKTKNALEMMLRRVVRGEDVDLYTGDCYRAVMHVDDVCRAIKLVIDKAPPTEVLFNVGPPNSVRMFDLIQHAKYVTGSRSRINLVAPPRFHQIVQVDSFHMDTTKLRTLGFIPQMDAYQAVERVIAGLC